MTKLFINYRHEDSQYQADLLYELIKPWVENPREDIFIDVDNIPAGVDFVEHLDDKVQQCDALIVVIGKNWLHMTDPRTGQRRLDNPDDFVRIEIESGLKRNIPVAPVLLDGVPMPPAADLPDSLKPLARRNGVGVSRLSFESDVNRLMRNLPIKLKTPTIISGESAAVSQRSLSGKLVDPVKRHQPGSIFRDTLSIGSEGPEMVVIPSGSFTMGSPSGESGRDSDEGPLREVVIDYSFAVGKYAVTWADWDLCVSDGGCDGSGPDGAGGDKGWGKGSRPVINVDWNDAQAYADWLSGQTGESYRLLSEAEWEYVARAGTSTPFSFGAMITPDQANYDGSLTYGGGPKVRNHSKTVPVGAYPANGFGIYDLHGNVLEWVEDCYEDSYRGAPRDGSAWTDGKPSRRVLRGGSWNLDPQKLRSANRSRLSPTFRNHFVGFRLARTL